MIAYLRSNEIWKGLPTDFHFIIFLQEVIASWLNVEIGTYTHIVGSAHIYENNLANAKEFLAKLNQNNKITVILTHFNRPYMIDKQIEAIRKQTVKPTRIIVWYNKGKDEQKQINVPDVETD